VDYWIIDARITGFPPARLTMSKYGRVSHIQPPDSPFAIIQDIDGFDDDAHSGFAMDAPTVDVETALEEQRNVVGMRLHFRSTSGIPTARSEFIVLSLVPANSATSSPPPAPVSIEEELAQAEIDRIDRYQELTDAPQPEDGLPVSLTFRQVQKIAAIVDAARLGHDNYFDILKDVTKFLNAAAMEAVPGVGMKPTAAEVWAGIDSTVPWPLHGAPRSQPDVDS